MKDLRLNLLAFVLLLLGCSNLRQENSPLHLNRALQLIDTGTLELRQGHLEQAEAHFQLAYEIALLPQALDGLGCAAFLKGNFTQAEIWFLRALNQEHSYYNSIANLALLYEVMGKSDKATQYYRLAIEAEPTNYRARNNLAAMLADKPKGSPTTEQAVRTELLKAYALEQHAIVRENLNITEIGVDIYEQD